MLHVCKKGKQVEKKVGHVAEVALGKTGGQGEKEDRSGAEDVTLELDRLGSL